MGLPDGTPHNFVPRDVSIECALTLEFADRAMYNRLAGDGFMASTASITVTSTRMRVRSRLARLRPLIRRRRSRVLLRARCYTLTIWLPHARF